MFTKMIFIGQSKYSLFWFLIKIIKGGKDG